MTVQTDVSRSGPYAGAGTTGPFTVGFRFLDDSHLRVIQTSAAAVDTDLVLGSGYTVSGAGGNTGTVTTIAPVPVGSSITIIRNVPFTQEADYVDNDSFPAESHEEALDKLTMQTQQLREESGRALTLTPTVASDISAELPRPVALNVVGWDVTAKKLQNFTPQTFATIVAFGTANADKFIGDGVTAQFTLSNSPGSLNNLDIALGGVTQTPGADYDWDGDKLLTMAVAPPAGVGLLVRYMQGLPSSVTRAESVTYLPNGTGAVSTTVEDKLRETVSAKDFGAVGDAEANDTAAFVALEAAHKGQLIDLNGRTYLTDRNFFANKYINGVLLYDSIAVDGDVSILNPRNKGVLQSARTATAQETKSGLKIATINGPIQGAVLDHYSGILYVLSNSSGTVESLDEQNVIKAYKWNGQAATLVETSATSPSAAIGHQSLGMQVLQSGTRSTAGDVRLWSIAGVDKGADRSKYAVRFTPTPGGAIANVEHFKLWGDSVDGGTRTLGTCPQSKILVSTSVQGSIWTVRVFDMAVFNAGPGDYSTQHMVEFKINQFGRSLQDITTDGEFIYLYHGGTAFSSTFKYLDVYALDGTHVGTTKIQAGSLRAWEISEGGGDLLYEPEALFIGRGPFGYELLFANTNGTPFGTGERETTIYTLRPNHATHFKAADALTPGAIFDAVTDVAVPSGQAFTIGEVDGAGALSQLWNVSRIGQNQANNSGSLTVNYSSTGETGVRISNASRAGIFQVSASGNLGLWDTTRAAWMIHSSLAGNITITGNTLHAGNIQHVTDNVNAFGTASIRGTTIYLSSNPVVTSDQREKTEPKTPSDALLDAWSEVGIITHQWLAAIQEKGESLARWHFGHVAQQVRDALVAHGLMEAGSTNCAYGFLCYDEWDDVYEPVISTRKAVRSFRPHPDSTETLDVEVDEEYDTGEVRLAIRAGNRWGIRAEQCLFVEAAYQRRRADRIEARLLAIESRL